MLPAQPLPFRALATLRLHAILRQDEEPFPSVFLPLFDGKDVGGCGEKGWRKSQPDTRPPGEQLGGGPLGCRQRAYVCACPSPARTLSSRLFCRFPRPGLGNHAASQPSTSPFQPRSRLPGNAPCSVSPCVTCLQHQPVCGVTTSPQSPGHPPELPAGAAA